MTFGGHSPEHVCLWCPERSILVAGHQILPTISPVVGDDSASGTWPFTRAAGG
jgi:glyoxylase-like metal-dependent hydrolase (beta-lactamase superfamily II)